MSFPPVLVNLIAAGLFLGLVATMQLRPPPRRLRGPLVAFVLLVLLYIVGDAFTLTSPDLFWEQLGIALLYTGSLPAAAACLRVALSYADEQGHRMQLGERLWPLAAAAAAVSWLIMLTNPWHGRVLVPIVGADNVHLQLFYPVMGVGYLLTAAASAVFALVALRATDSGVRFSSWTMASGPVVTMLLNVVSHDALALTAVRWDLTVLGLSLTAILFLAGAYRTRVFALLPVAHSEILRHDPDGILLADRQGRLLRTNPAVAKLLGEAPPAGTSDLFAWLAPRLQGSSEGSPLPSELRERLEDPEAGGDACTFAVRADLERWLRASLTPIPPPPSRPAAISVRLVDVSRERHAAIELRDAHDELERRVAKRTEELRASEERYRIVSELSSDASFALDVGSDRSVRPRWYTDAMEQVTGWGPADLDALGWELPLHPADRDRVERTFAEMPEGARRHVEFRIVTPSGETKWLAVDVRYVESRGSVSFVVGAVRDVSERQRAEAESQALGARMQEVQRLESLGVLAGGIAHDFNNLLAVVLGNSTLGLQEVTRDSPLHRRFERIREASDHAAMLTEQMLTYAGRAEPKRVVLDVSSVVDRTLDLLRAAAGSGCVVRTELAHALPPILGDETQLRQVLLNLVTNAAEASGGRGEVRIATRLEHADRELCARTVGASHLEPGEYVSVTVSDRGPGMDEATMRRVFDPFFTTKFAGRGLGLAVVLGIVRTHSGAIALETRPGQGTRFRILFPCAEGEVAPSVRPPARSSSGSAAATVLVVDDDEAVLEFLSESLELAGFRVHRARGGRAALARIEAGAEAFDAAVVDLTMPEVDGREVLAAIRRVRGELPSVVISGFGVDTAAERLAGLGAAAFVRKPITPEDLVRTLTGVLSGRSG